MWSNYLAAAVCSGVVGFSKLNAKDAGLLKNNINNREGLCDGMRDGARLQYLAVPSVQYAARKKVQGSACAGSGTAGTVQPCAYPLEKVIALPLGCSGKGQACPVVFG